jgi:iron complex transport system permease protein
MNRVKTIGAPVTLAFALALALLLGLHAGAAGFRASALVQLLAGDEIVAFLRAPRVALAAITGGSLALAGVAMQALLRNDLADPYVLGVAGGASTGAVVSLALLPALPPGPAAAGGAAAATALVRAFGGREPVRLVLAGVAVGSMLASATGLVVVLAPAERLGRSLMAWLFGSLGTPAPLTLVVPGGLLVAAAIALQTQATRLDRLLLGDDTAHALGVDVPRLRGRLLVVAVALTASAVAAAGLVGFVGLVAPHLGRRLVGPEHRALLPCATLLGAILLVLADTVARTAFAPREVPVGLLTAALGGPFFLWLLGRREVLA